MTESIKFGPEWLRNSVANVPTTMNDQSLGGSNSNLLNSTSVANPRLQLSENRYGREEMLSLCDKNPKKPDILPKYKKLFVEQPQCPLALTPQTEEELRSYNARGSITPGLGRGGRGGSIDRGRGRARTSFHTSLSYQRSSSLYDEEQRGTGRGERLWLDRNGSVEGQVDWTNPSSISPRKEFGAGRSTSIENWRKSRTDEEGGDWRNPSAPTREKWARSTSWRDDETPGSYTEGGLTANNLGMSRGPNSSMNDANGAGDNTNSERNPSSMKSMNLLNSKKSWDEENLPEWATEDPFDYGGSFDATGAFHDAEDDGIHLNRNQHDYNNEDRLDQKNHEKGYRDVSPKNIYSDSDTEPSSQDSKKKQDRKDSDLSEHDKQNDGGRDADDEDDYILQSSQDTSGKKKYIDDQQSFQSKKHSSVESEQLRDPGQDDNQRKRSQMNDKSQEMQAQQQLEQQQKMLAQQKLAGLTQRQNEEEMRAREIQEMQEKQREQQLRQQKEQLEMQQRQEEELQRQQKAINKHPKHSPRPQELDDKQHNIPHLEMQNLHLQSEPNMPGKENLKHHLAYPLHNEGNVHQVVAPQNPDDMQQDLNKKQRLPHEQRQMQMPPQLQQQQPQQQHPEHQEHHQQQKQPNQAQASPQQPGIQPTSMTGLFDWFYRDPQGEVQGPFTALEMSEWYKAGYFRESLQVKRSCDNRFYNLGELVTYCSGGIPFIVPNLILPMNDPINGNTHILPNATGLVPGPNVPAAAAAVHDMSMKFMQPNLTDIDNRGIISNEMPQMNYLPSTRHLEMLNQQNVVKGHQNVFNLPQNKVSVLQQPQAPLPPQPGPNQSDLMKKQMMSSQQVQHPANTSQPPSQLLAQHAQQQNQPHDQAQQSQQTPLQIQATLRELNRKMMVGQPGVIPPMPQNVNKVMPDVRHMMRNMDPPQPQSLMSVPNAPLPQTLSQQTQPQSIETDPIKSLLLQLQIQKTGSASVIPKSSNDMSNWMKPPAQSPLNTILNVNNSKGLHHHTNMAPPMPDQPQSNMKNANMVNMVPSNMAQPPMPSSSSAHWAGTPLSMWELGIQLTNNNIQSQQPPHLQQEPSDDQLQQKQFEIHQQQMQLHQKEQRSDDHHTQQLQKHLLEQCQDDDQQQYHQQMKQKQMQLQAYRPDENQQSYYQGNNKQQKILEQQQQEQLQQQNQLQQQQVKVDRKPEQSSHQALEEKMMIASKREMEQQMQNNLNQNKQKKQLEEEEKFQIQQKKSREQQKKIQNENAQKKEAAEKREAEEKRKLKESKKQQLQQQQMIEEDQKKKRLQQQMEELKNAELKKKQQQQLQHQQQIKQQQDHMVEQNIQATITKIHQQQQLQEKQRAQQEIAMSVNRMAPWSNSMRSQPPAPGLNFEEIQKAEQEAARRAENIRMDQQMREQQMMEMQQKENILKWNAQNILPKNVKSLEEIQAEEQAKQAALDRERETQAASQAKREKKDQETLQNLTSYWNNNNIAWNSNKPWGNQQKQQMPGSSTSTGGFWEEPTKISQTKNANMKIQQSVTTVNQSGNKILLSKSQTMASITTSNSNAIQAATAKQRQNVAQNVANSQQKSNKGNNNDDSDNTSNSYSTKNNQKVQDSKNNAKNNNPSTSKNKKDDNNNDFTLWCTKALVQIKGNVDIPTFIGFLKDIESPFEVKDYIKMYLGETKECLEFAKQFLERRSKYKNMQRAQNAHIDDMCSPAPAITPSNDFQEVKGKNKKVKKNKMTKVDNRILGFSVSAAPDRLNVGDRDYGETS